MGDRGNILVRESEEAPAIYFYTHWSGSELPIILQEALKRGKGRWDDPAYLNRIIFCEMVKDDVLDETGFGISLEEQDNEHQYVEVIHDKGTVKIGNNSWKFSEYVGLETIPFDED